MDEAPQYLLIGGVAIFLGFVALQAMWPRSGSRVERKAARAKHSAAVSRGSDGSHSEAERSTALVEAGRLAIDELRRPRLAARHAEWAHRLTPTSPAVIDLLLEALPKARRLRALERLLWQSADTEGPRGDHARQALIRLYEGPMKLPARGRALRYWQHR